MKSSWICKIIYLSIFYIKENILDKHVLIFYAKHKNDNFLNGYVNNHDIEKWVITNILFLQGSSLESMVPHISLVYYLCQGLKSIEVKGLFGSIFENCY